MLKQQGNFYKKRKIFTFVGGEVARTMGKVIAFFCIVLLCIGIGLLLIISSKKIPAFPRNTISPTAVAPLNGLTIEAMRQKLYPGSPLVIEQTLPDGSNYHTYIASYISDGLKIYGLLTVPTSPKPKNGFPVVIFNHGYLAPSTYQTNSSVGQYATYVPPLSQAGYIVFKPDYRGNGNSEGTPEGAYYSPAYATDVLNAIASIKMYSLADAGKIGMWGHSMGGNITLRDIVVDTKDIKAAVIWGGVVGSYTDLEHWHDPAYHPSAYELSLRYRFRADLEKKYGTPETDPLFWNSIDPTMFVSDITTPIQLHAGTADEEVPPFFSESLKNTLTKAGKTVELYEYPGDNHNISGNFTLAMNRSIAFFDKYLK